MALQDIINSAVNIEVNRSKLVAQNVSRSGRISVASRNWSNPFRFTITPKPVWTAAEYRLAFQTLLDRDRYGTHSMMLNDMSTTTFLANRGNSWMIPYQGSAATANVITSYNADTTANGTSGTKVVLTNINSTTITPGTYLFKTGDYLRVTGSRYPYIVTTDVIIPTAASGITGTIQPAGVNIFTAEGGQGNLSYVSTTTTTAITGITSTAGLSAGQILTKTSGTGVLGGLTYIASVDSTTQVSIISTTANTSGSVTFNGSSNTGTPSVCVPIHRGYIETFTTAGAVRVGARAAAFNVIVTKLPQIRYLPGQFVELTSDIELIEEIL